MLRSFAVTVACLLAALSWALTAPGAATAGTSTPLAASATATPPCHVGGSWGDPQPGDDTSGCVVVTPASPTFVDGTCDDAWNGIVIDHTPGVNYYLSVDGGAERYVGNSRHRLAYGISATITARAMSGRITSGTTVWQHDFPAAGSCGPTGLQTVTADDVTFLDPACDGTGATVTVPGTDGVAYLRDGLAVTAGEHDARAGSTWTVTAQAVAGYRLAAPATWTHTLAVDPGCVRPAAVRFTAPTCSWPGGSYTVPSTAGVDYVADGRVLTAGRHALTAGQGISISASARTGHTLYGDVEWDTAGYARAGSCPGGTSTPPAGRPSTGSTGTGTGSTGSGPTDSSTASVAPVHATSSATSTSSSTTPAHRVDAAAHSRTPAAAGTDRLANTGTPTATLLAVGGALLCAGVALLLLTTRRRPAGYAPRHH